MTAHLLDRKAQADFGVGGLIALMVLIAIGALVLYSVTGALNAGNPTVTRENVGTSTLSVPDTPQSARLVCTVENKNLGTAGAWHISVVLNGDNIVDATTAKISSDNDVITYVNKGTNTLVIATDNENVKGTAVLTITTYVSGAIGNVEGKGSTVFNLLTILAIVIVAALIIGVVIRAIGGATMGGPTSPPPSL